MKDVHAAIELDTIIELRGRTLFICCGNEDVLQVVAKHIHVYRTCHAPVALYVCFARFGNGGSTSVLTQH